MNDKTFPKRDREFEDVTVAKVERSGGGWLIERSDGWSFYVPPESPVAPTVGARARFYGRGIGYSVRGLFINGRRVFYRTAAEHDEYEEIERYGADAADWLRRWDAGKTVWSIEMGGLGPAYEQCIHIVAAEILRFFIAQKYDPKTMFDGDNARRVDDETSAMSHTNPIIKGLGISGAQWGGALNLAANIYRKGPRQVMRDTAVKDRHIQVQRYFPQAAALA